MNHSKHFFIHSLPGDAWGHQAIKSYHEVVCKNMKAFKMTIFDGIVLLLTLI